MPNLNLTFINAGDSAEMDAEVDSNMRAEEIINSLIGAQFIPENTDPARSYMLSIKGRTTIAEGQTLANAGVQDHDTIRVSVTQRGGTTRNR